MDNNKKHHKMQFQIERIAFFSDAIFAIAITLMIIEIKPPHFEKGISSYAAIIELLKMTPMFMGLIVSFFVIGIYWQRHHQLMQYVDNYNTKLLWDNLLLLFSIVLIPFTTAFNSENALSLSSVPMILINLNYIVATLLNYRLYKYVLAPQNDICHTEVTENLPILYKELTFPLVVYSFVILLAFIHPYIAPMGYALFSFEGFFTKTKKKPKLPVETS
ncbi:MAG TPA: TMEM175 family protein [Saprospiraceae bacterium]|nr:TMEM175 family protein [Saprospiraceae bacterium]